MRRWREGWDWGIRRGCGEVVVQWNDVEGADRLRTRGEEWKKCFY